MKSNRQEYNYQNTTNAEQAERSKRWKKGLKELRERHERWNEKEYIVWMNTAGNSVCSSGDIKKEISPQRHWHAFSLNELIDFLNNVQKGFTQEGKYGMYTKIDITPVDEEWEWVKTDPRYSGSVT